MTMYRTRAERRPGPRLDPADAARELAQVLARLVPHAPPGEIAAIVAWSCDPRNDAVGLAPGLPPECRAAEALYAHVRHAHTGYDQILTFSTERGWTNARNTVRSKVRRIVHAWETGETPEKRDRDQARGCRRPLG